MNHRRWMLMCVAAVVAGATGAGMAADHSGGIVISKETTYITQPLRADGLPDYVAAYNAGLPKVKPEENALYWIVKAVGPQELSPTKGESDRMKAQLGLADLPDEGPYFQKYDEYWGAQNSKGGHDLVMELAKVGQNATIKEAMLKRLFSPDELASVKAWAKAEEGVLGFIEKAAQQDVWITPVLAEDDDSGWRMGWSDCNFSDDAALLLLVKAHVEFSDGHQTEAERLAIEALRLGGLQSRSLIAGEVLTGGYQELCALRVLRVFLHAGKWTDHDMAQIYLDIQSVPPFRFRPELFDSKVRFEELVSVERTARGELEDGLGRILRGPLDDPRIGDYQLLDWNIILRSLNQQFDQLHDLATINDRKLFHVRYDSLQAAEDHAEVEVTGSRAKDFDTDAEKAAKLKNLQEFFKKRNGESATLYSERIAHAFTEMRSGLYYFKIQQARRLEWTVALTEIALARFHAVTGKYPEALKELVPMYMDAVPQDEFSDGELVYEHKDDGYGLHTVGPKASK